MNVKEQHVLVMVVTTSGTWPAEGFDETPAHQKVRQQLEKAAKGLRLTETTNWFAQVNGVEIDVEKNYLELNLSGSIIIDYGPREGGGGQIHE